MPPASLASSGEKLGMDPRIGQPTCCGLCQGPFFSRVVGSVQICRHTSDIRGKRTCRVGQVFPCRVYIDLNRRDSQI
jgi:hypothetical protein